MELRKDASRSVVLLVNLFALAYQPTAPPKMLPWIFPDLWVTAIFAVLEAQRKG